ncbi:MAG: sulfatase-like hydrolase/transferase [Gammaproteobacteria bacterium]|nr:sulfatase-like hydrolase/transferase [Gammaproteobacteria bacterium]
MLLQKRSWTLLKGVFCFLTLLILLLQFYFLSLKLPLDTAYTNKMAGFLTIFLHKLGSNFSLWKPLIAYVLAHIFIQTFLVIIIYWLAKELVKTSHVFERNLFLVGILLWLLCQTSIYLWNGYLFPYSYFSMKLPHHSPIYLAALIVTTSLLLIIVGLVLFRIIVSKPRGSIITLVVFFLGWSSLFLYKHYAAIYFFPTTQSPNIILIITDSLRPDYAKQSDRSIHVKNFIDNAAFFSNSLTLLGRSTPGLVSILTGAYPKNNGARFNLIPQHYLKLENSLSRVLKSQGYQTIFAADGRQFVNINADFGFDQVIAAQSGIYDFIFSLVNDTPLSNLLMNTVIGEILFPYNYANRNSYFTYLPGSFINLVDNRLINKSPGKPVLFIAALTVAHWPYVWAKQPNFESLAERYEDSVIQLDNQFGELLTLLKKRGLLQNSIIITLSDHGDSLGLPGDRITEEQNYRGPTPRLATITRFPYMKFTPGSALIGMDTSSGHGTDLLSMTQLQTTLAFRSSTGINPQTITQRVALIDVAPTLFDLLGITPKIPFDGVSLRPIMMGGSQLKNFDRPLFLESEIDIPLIDITAHRGASTFSRLINKYANLYDIDLTTQQLVLRDTAIAPLLSEKQRGIIEGKWLLVHFPGKNRLQTEVIPSDSPELKNCYYFFPATKNQGKISQMFCYKLSPTMPNFVLVNLETKQWQIFFQNEESQNPTFSLLLNKLKGFYGRDLSE